MIFIFDIMFAGIDGKKLFGNQGMILGSKVNVKVLTYAGCMGCYSNISYMFNVGGSFLQTLCLPKICVDVNNGFGLLKSPWILKVNVKLLKLWPCDHLLGQR